MEFEPPGNVDLWEIVPKSKSVCQKRVFLFFKVGLNLAGSSILEFLRILAFLILISTVSSVSKQIQRKAQM